MFTYRDIVFRMRQGESDRAIHRATGVGRPKLAKIRETGKAEGWVDPQIPLGSDEALAAVLGKPPVLPAQMVSPLLAYREQIEGWVKQGIRLTAIHAALKRTHGYSGSYSAVLRFVRRVMPEKPPEAFVPLSFEPGEAAQVDFGQGPLLLDPVMGVLRKSWVFVMTLCFSRHAFVCFVFDQRIGTWLLCHRQAFEFFGGVVRRVILDNLKAAIVKACWYDPEVQKSYYEFAEAFGFIISPCKVATPEHKGRVESGVGYAKKSFVPLRDFRDIHDANRQALVWCVEEAGTRLHGRTFQKPFEVFTTVEKSALLPLPADPFELPTWKNVTVHGDCHVVFAKVFYSVPYRLVGKVLWLRATDTTVHIYQDHQLVAIHLRGKRPGQRHTLDEHLPPEKVAWLMKTPRWCLARAGEVGPCCLLFIERLLGDTVVDRLRAAQGVLRLSDKYGAPRLEAACRRALHYDSIGYKVVERILKGGFEQLELLPVETSAPVVPSRYGRSIGALLQSQN